MKRSLLLLCAVLFVAVVPPTPAHADDSVPIDFFYDSLSPYGDWVYTQNYGYIWQPLVSQQSNWAPYADGYWAYTDAGWTWISNEDFGWATYHYGRWIRLQQNWFWVPGYEWAPAWVSWRQTQGQIGWAPLPPEAAWAPTIGFGGWTDSYYDVGPSYYNFVPNTAFVSSTSLIRFILDRSLNFNYYGQSVNITNISYRQNVVNHIFVGGPDLARINHFGSNQVRRLTLRRDDESFRRDWLNHNGNRPRGTGSLSHIDHNHLVVAAPSIRRENSHGMPPRVREHLQQPVIDRGWHGAGDAQNMNRMREQQRNDLTRTRPQQLPEKTQRPATSTAPPPAFGRVLKPEERNGGTQRPGPRRMNEEVRPATPVTPTARPGTPSGRPQVPVTQGNPPRTEEPRRDNRPSKPSSTSPDSQRPVPGNREQRPEHMPAATPAPTMPQQQRPSTRPTIPQRQQPSARPTMPQQQQPSARPTMPQQPQPSARPTMPQRQQPSVRPTMPQRQQPSASPSAPQGNRGPQNSSRRDRKP